MIILIPPSEGKASGGTHPAIKPSKETQTLLKEHNIKLKSNTLPAIQRYTGVVYKGIEYETLTKSQQNRFDKHVRIISALFGLVKPDQLLPEYKLPITGKLATYWQPTLTEQLKDEFVINLLPKAHKKALQYTKGIQVEFGFIKDNQLKPAGHFGKLIKGKFVRWMMQNNIKPDQLHTFQEDGFKLYKKENNLIVFAKQ